MSDYMTIRSGGSDPMSPPDAATSSELWEYLFGGRPLDEFADSNEVNDGDDTFGDGAEEPERQWGQKPPQDDRQGPPHSAPPAPLTRAVAKTLIKVTAGYKESKKPNADSKLLAEKWEDLKNSLKVIKIGKGPQALMEYAYLKWVYGVMEEAEHVANPVTRWKTLFNRVWDNYNTD